ncbi:MAG: hypothetical protein HY898_27815 [Deltaproteobacteria bacterium]|nr:hypothetical protein [Deltaproteobacteria bacterium]
MSDVTIDAPATHPIASITLTENGPATVRWRDGRVQRFVLESDVYYRIVPLRTVREWFEEQRIEMAWTVGR